MTGAIQVRQVGYMVGVKAEAPVDIKRDGMAHLLMCPFLTFPTRTIIIPPLFPGSLQRPTFSLAFFIFLIAIFFNT